MSQDDRSSPPTAPAQRRPRLVHLEAVALVVLVGVGLSLSAGPLPDPTRPPSSLAAPAPSGPPGPARSPSDLAALAAARQAAADAAAAAATPKLPPLSDLVLQAVQSPARGPAQALINGQLVKVGDPLAGRQVASIDGQGVVLRGAAGTERLWLLGDASKQAAGSIQTSRSTQYTPAQDNPEANAAGEANPRAERSSPPSAVSLARRTQP